ncbi:uncharacterized protein LOC131008504 [Salvia miltiorrhiza]|uniref:uncharacterized protein LOC131008504 n=1 Tax=Salvia miltiorrhiza TaxID=226208 RepID=UPI0025AB6754|nr:uncharacterized protein LOC131008504 [Salvia miltiorrhiza]
MASETPKSKKSKGMTKQPDLRQFMFKKMKSQESESSSPTDKLPQAQENVINLGGSSSTCLPLEDKELIYDVELLPHDPGKRISIMDYPPNERDVVRRAYILKNLVNQKLMIFLAKTLENEVGLNAGGDAFVNRGFKSWNKPERFLKHVGVVKSAHNLAYEKYANLRDGKKKSILISFENDTDVIQREYEIRLKASISYIINCCAKETTKRIVEELGDGYFAILAYESSDVSQKEQLALCLFYVEGKMGKVVERFLGLVHVGDTTALSLRSAIMSLLVEHSLSPSKIRGQGYDGASNMKGEINGLKTLIRGDTPSAYYVHCFAHQLQLTLVAIAKKNNECVWLFDTFAILLNVIGVSCKRREMIREFQAQKVAWKLVNLKQDRD